MNVTYLIGNGFDIACGLKTKFSDFIQEYLLIKSDDNDICHFKSLIEEDICTWADAEYAFGQLTEKVNSVKLFNKCYRDFLFHLKLYLENQQKILKGPIKKAEKTAFIRGLKEVQRYLQDERRREFESCMSCIDKCTINYNFLIFNYTEVFQNLLNRSLIEKSEDLGAMNLCGNNCECKLGTIEYVHGSLSSPPIIFGVNDPEQIRQLIHRPNPEMSQILVKPYANRTLSPMRFNRCIDTIKQSDVICTYGMSLGQTDALWWKEILNLLSENKNSNLIIHYWEPRCDEAVAGDVIQTIKDCKRRFITNAQSDVRTQRSLKDRMHVIINQNPFHIVMHA